MLAAGRDNTTRGRDALAKLCQTYWYPLYAYVRQRGYTPHFLVDEWKKARARKRGGGQVVSLDARDAETRFGREPVDAITPEKLFEQNWALSLLDSVYRELQREYQRDARGALFHELKFCLTGARSAVPYAVLAERLNMPENTVKTSVHRLRQRYRELLRAEVAHTVASPGEVEEELRSLFRALAGS